MKMYEMSEEEIEVVVIGRRNYAFFWIWTILILIIGIVIGVIVE